MTTKEDAALKGRRYKGKMGTTVSCPYNKMLP
jgi:hypothetical protein